MKKKTWLPIAEPARELVRGKIASTGGTAIPGHGRPRPRPTPVGPGPSPMPRPTTRDNNPYKEEWWSPTTVIRLVDGATANGYAWDANSRYQGGQLAPRMWRTFQWWMCVRSTWTTTPGLRYCYEPSSTSGALVIEYNANTVSNAGMWRIGRNITIASGYIEFTHLIPRDEWHHITIVYDNSELRFYVDGVLEHSDTSRRWFAEYHEGNTTIGNQTTAAVQGHSAGGIQPAFTHGAVFRAFSHAMSGAEVAATWNRVLWPGYDGMTYQLVGLDTVDIRNSGYMDNYCWNSLYEAIAVSECLFNQTPPVSFPAIRHQVMRDVDIAETTHNIDINTWATGNVSAWPANTLKTFPGVTTDAVFASVVDPGGGNPKYLAVKPVASGTCQMFCYVDPASVGQWNQPHVAKGGLSIIVLAKDYYQSNNRLYISLGKRPGHTDMGHFCLSLRDTYTLYALNTSGAPGDSLATATPGTGVTRNWYFHYLQWIPGTRRRDGASTGTLRARWWPEGDGIGSPPGSWNLSVDVSANATHKRYLVGGAAKMFANGNWLEYSGHQQIVSPQFQINFQMNNGETGYIKYIRAKELAYDAP